MTQPVPAQPGTAQPKGARRATGGRETPRGRGGADRPPTAEGPPGPRGPRGLGRWGSLSGGLGVGIIAASAAVGAIATAAARTQPGQVLSVCIVVGTFVAALAVRPSAGRLIFPAPALFYLMAALAAGIFYDRSAPQTQQAVDAAQWIANGFFAMAIATGLAIVLTTVRWFSWHRRRRVPVAPDRPPPAGGTSRRPRTDAGESGGSGGRRDGRGPGGWGNPAPPGARPGQLPRAPDERPGPRPGWQSDQYQAPTWPRPEAGPYNFSSGA
jgi:hypothetical protein